MSRALWLVVVVDGRFYARRDVTVYQRAHWLRFAREDLRTVQVWEESATVAHLLTGWQS